MKEDELATIMMHHIAIVERGIINYNTTFLDPQSL